MAANPLSQLRLNWRKFLQPTWLAGAISVGFHGVLFAVSPTFPSLGFDQLTETDLEDDQRNVPLVELTAAERERLPDFSSSFYDFEEFGDLSPLAPLFEGNTQLGNRNRGSNSKPLLSPGGSSSPPSAYNLPFDITGLGRSRSSLPLAGGGPLGSSGTETVEPDAMTPGKPAAANANEPGADALRSESEGADSISREEAEAIAANSNPANTLTPEQRLQAYTFNADKTVLEDVNISYIDWLATGETFAQALEIGDADTISTAFEAAAAAGILAPVTDEEAAEAEANPVAGIVRRPLELPIEYDAGICLTKDPQKGLIGAWVSPLGELLGDPEVIRSTGYPGLNQQAIDYIKTLDFSTVNRFTGYQFEVLVAYEPDNCVEIGNRGPTTRSAGTATDTERANSEEDKPTPLEKLRSPVPTDQRDRASAADEDSPEDTNSASPAE